MKQILFVDDEIKVLEGLGRMLRTMRHDWDMTFLADPREAVKLIADKTFDAIVVDMRMPVMDGTALLQKARECRPGMARIVLSGHAEREAAMRSVGLAHQFLAKPCDADTLRGTVARACELRDLLHDGGLASSVCELGKLPSLPRLYHAITEEMNHDEVSLKRVAAIISHDIAMTAKVLQLVNSAFFGLGRRVSSIEQAVSYLGVDVIRSLVVSQAAFAEFELVDLDFFRSLWKHSWATGAVAKRISELESRDPIVHGEALQAGMLHDIGALVLAARVPEKYRKVREPHVAGEAALLPREQELFGCDHGRVGAYLLGLWGLSDRIVEALAYHHCPRECAYAKFAPLTAVHAANALVLELSGECEAATEMDMDYLTAIGCAERLPQWQQQAERIMSHIGAEDD